MAMVLERRSEGNQVVFHSRPLCIFHSFGPAGHCDDGFASALIVNRRFGGAADFHPAVYGSPPPELEGRDVIIADFSYPVPIMAEIAGRCRSLLFIDHHRTAMAAASRVEEFQNATVRFDLQACGAMLTWRYFYPDEEPPPFLHYVNDRDLWLHRMPNTKRFTVGLRSWPQTFERWELLIDDTSALIADGGPIERYYDRQIEACCGNRFDMEIGGHLVPVANAPHMYASEIANAMCMGKPFAASFYVGPDRKIVFSLRSDDRGLDVSEIAKLYGGGGHKHAAGFTAPPGMLPWGDATPPAERRATSALAEEAERRADQREG